MRPLLYYTGNMGFCANLNALIKVIDYCKDRELHVCCDYGMHGNLEDYFEFPEGLHFVKGFFPPGYLMADHPKYDVCHPYWDEPNPTLALYDEINSIQVSFERQREIVQSWKPKIKISPPCEKYDAVHIRRGDALTSGEGAMYHHANEYVQKTTLNDVFVMSDDFRVISEIPRKVHHMIPEGETGNWSTPNYVTKQGEQPVFMFRSHEKKKQITERLVQEMYIAANSETFVHECSSVAHFIKLIHKNPERCISL